MGFLSWESSDSRTSRPGLNPCSRGFARGDAVDYTDFATQGVGSDGARPSDGIETPLPRAKETTVVDGI